jgi:hypothetical protein
LEAAGRTLTFGFTAEVDPYSVSLEGIMLRKDKEALFQFVMFGTLGLTTLYGIHTAFAPRDYPLPVDSLRAAPALPPKCDEMTGELATRLDSPVLLTVIPADGGEPPRESVLWLVFPDAKRELDSRKFEPGTRVTVAGKLMAGGAFRYVVVESIGAEAKR